MHMLRSAAVIAAAGLVVFSLASMDVAKARVHGFVGHSHGFVRHSIHHRAFDAGPWFGAVEVSPPDLLGNISYTGQATANVTAPALTCHRSYETLTVPSEGGGTKEIRISRC